MFYSFGAPPLSLRSWQFDLALVCAACEGVGQTLVNIRAAATSPFVHSGATGIFVRVFFEVRTFPQVSCILSPPLRLSVQVPAPFQLLSGMYSYLPTQSWTNFGKAASSGMMTHRIAASTSLCPLSGSFSSHLSITQAMVPATSTV